MSASALVFGGTGTVGREVLRGLAEAGVPTVFTWHQSADRAKVLATELGQKAVQLDLADAAAIRSFFRDLDRESIAPDVFVHCAAVARTRPFAALTDDDWDAVHAVNVRSAFVAAQELGARMARAGKGDMVFLGALDRTQSAPAPPHFAASQGALAAMTMALAKELGPRGIRVNMIALGPLEAGLSRELDPRLLEDFRTFSALKRTGTAREAAAAILWLARENTYMSGKVLPVNGGI